MEVVDPGFINITNWEWGWSEHKLKSRAGVLVGGNYEGRFWKPIGRVVIPV